MFCQHCGSKQEEGAKFCVGCGKQAVSDVTVANNGLRASSPLEEKVFLERDGILVSDAVFRTGSGESYPIRNISSVAVAAKPHNGLILTIAIIITLFGLFLMFGSASAGVFVVVLSAPFWLMLGSTSHQLKIGAGGVLQTAIESRDERTLNDVARAINDSILYIQRGK